MNVTTLFCITLSFSPYRYEFFPHHWKNHNDETYVRIARLYILLVKEKIAFEQVAQSTNDKQPVRQRAVELPAKWRVNIQRPERTDVSCPDKYFNEKEIIPFCNMKERKLINAHRKILQASSGYEGLEEMIGYQFNGILLASKQLKLLSSMKTSGMA